MADASRIPSGGLELVRNTEKGNRKGESMGVLLLARATWEEVGALQADKAVALLPTGACEQHGPHLPMETDSYLVTSVCAEALNQVSERAPELDVLVLPTLPVGNSSHHLAFPGTLSLRATTYIQVIKELCESLYRHGFRRMLIVNGHGGNADCLRVAAREVRDRSECLVGVISYWHAAEESISQLRRSPLGGICHAGEMETACMLHLDSEAVRSDRIVKEMPRVVSPQLTLDLVGPTSCINHNVRDYSATGVLGDPTVADATHGAKLLEAIVSDLADLILDFSRWDLGKLVTDNGRQEEA